ncbi:MAG: biotin--[acetyl-CoA-carboxylase] ligase [Ignavibacteriaceae bacterium]|nr:biotin--[acetyl-CoA-carboxylase] ligase [Ignavibacteriaceae bacterium]
MFNIEVFDLKLNTDFIGRNFVYAEEVSSTNSFLLDKNSNYNQSGTVVLAEKQLVGRGRMDRVWYSQKDQNLTFSILLKGNKKFSQKINLINFAATLAIAISIENLYQLRTELKWPNDVLLSGKKVSGILIESTSSGSKIEHIVIGIGINVNQTIFQGKFNITPTSIRNEINDMVDRERFLAEVLNNFEEFLNKAIENGNLILREWRERCKMIGERITVTDGKNIQYGIFEDIDESGFLLLKSKDKMQKIHFGDVSIV